jgi:hypothetical protein
MKRILVSIFCVAIGAALAAPVAAQKGEPKKAAKKKPAKLEKLACRLGTEDEHARIAVLLADGKVESFAYYSKWKPRTCSMDVKRDDAFSKWVDTGNTTVVTLVEEKGAFLIDHNPGRYHFIFRDIDRMRYCGMEGKVNGSLTIWKGKAQCQVTGVMDREQEAVAAVKPAEPVKPLVGDGEAVAAQPPVSAPEVKLPLMELKLSPVEKPAQAPVEKPAQAPVEKPEQAPVEKPAQAPVEKPAQAPVEKPAQAPAPAVQQAPKEAAKEAPKEVAKDDSKPK